MSKAGAPQLLLERLIATNGFSVRKSKQDDAHWFTSGKPGPFYINTENIAGEPTAGLLLQRITAILKDKVSKEQQVKAIWEMISDALEADEAYNASIDALLDYYLAQNSFKPTSISGGERRDWFFSIPIAQKLQIPHIFLFKSGDYLVTNDQGAAIELALPDQKVLHVADIINLATSYLERWIPILTNHGVELNETLSVAVRSQEGIHNLRENKVSVISPLIVDIPLFTEAYNLGLIDDFAINEIRQFYNSPKSWTRQFLSENNIDYSQVAGLDVIKKERIASFKNNDPYHLRSEFPLFFS
ncbi:hypothetical protein [Paenibacillus agricola]|uniref:Uncharacterized protein n=1 Tax=Paenibacillus agricola TaxID=2716264 RepID=A0ABX0JFF7_9BACL|nr:hypothetical protein [Paenibacillus agricola]NHN34506.1 hypothetical protein [Paenibacillus agricola]